MRPQLINDQTTADGIIRQQQSLAIAYNSGSAIRWANLVTNAVYYMGEWWDLNGPLASNAWSTMVDDIRGAVGECCPIIEEIQTRIALTLPNEARLKNTIQFIQALEVLGIEHEFSPEFIKQLLIYKLEKE